MTDEFSSPNLEPGKINQVPPLTASATTPGLPSSPKSFNRLWLLPVVLIAVLAIGFYLFYAQSLSPSETEKESTPAGVPSEGTGYPSSSSATPEATSSLTSSDSFSDIEKDLGNAAVDAGAQDFTDLKTDLQGL